MPSRLSVAGWRKVSSACVSAKEYVETLNHPTACFRSFVVTDGGLHDTTTLH